MPITPLIEERVEAEQLAASIRRLRQENAVLRENQSPAAGALDLQAENIVLRREAEMLRQALPEFVPHGGPLPKTLADFNALPEAHRRQILREQPAHAHRLQEVDVLVRAAQRRGQHEARRRAALEGAGVAGMEELASLPPDRRRRLVLKMTPQQRRALLGLPSEDARGPGYL